MNDPLSGQSALDKSALVLSAVAIADWLRENRGLIDATFQRRPLFFPVVGGGLVDGLLAKGSDLDLCMILDRGDPQADLDDLQSSYSISMHDLHDQLRKLGLRGLCRIGRRIHRADEFLGLDRCMESRAGFMRTGVALNYILSCRLLDLGRDQTPLRARLATRSDLLQLKKRIYDRYREALAYWSRDQPQWIQLCHSALRVRQSGGTGFAGVPMLPYLLSRPGSYTPHRVKVQIQVTVNNLLLARHGIHAVRGSLDERISKVVDSVEGTLDEKRRREMKGRF